jgi:acyl carrier protein
MPSDPRFIQLQEYICTEIIHNPSIMIDADTPLISSGLIESLAQVDILVKLEEITHCKLPVSRITIQDLETVRIMFAMAERLGRSLYENGLS